MSESENPTTNRDATAYTLVATRLPGGPQPLALTVNGTPASQWLNPAEEQAMARAVLALGRRMSRCPEAATGGSQP